MLFHVTITHSQEDCPGRRPGETPALISPADRRAELGDELTVTSLSVVWGASCILWAEPEHVAYVLLEAPSIEAVERYLEARTPVGWAKRALPVFMLPSQLAAVRQLLAVPVSISEPSVSISEPPASVSEPPASVTVPPASVSEPTVSATLPPAALSEAADDHDAADTLKGLTAPTTEAIDEQVAAPPPDEARVATMPPTVVAPPDEPPAGVRPDSSAVTRFIERPVIPAVDEPRPSSESPTVILEPKSAPAPRMRLVANTGPSQGSIFDVREDGATLGRLPENSISLTDGRLSRHHARIEFRDGAYWLSDLGSQNGTLVNDHALTEAHLLQPGDIIELGTTRLTVMLDSDD
jgi:FHA domain